MITTQFCIELECSLCNNLGRYRWSAKTAKREYLVQEKQKRGEEWFFFGGGDFNYPRDHAEKREGRRRLNSSFSIFNKFIKDIDIGKITSAGTMYTWANNREGECFVKERLDKIFGAATWFMQYPKAKVIYKAKQTSDHHLLVPVSNPEVSQVRKRFCFDQR